MNFENNVLAILSFAATQATWCAATTVARRCHMETRAVIMYLSGRYYGEYGHDYFSQIAYRFHFDFRIRREGRTHYIAASPNGYG